MTVYKENAFSGASEKLGSGNYDYDQLVKGIGNDTISSIHIAPGYQVTLFSDANYKGATILLTDDVNDLGNFNHQVSSLKIVKISAK